MAQGYGLQAANLADAGVYTTADAERSASLNRIEARLSEIVSTLQLQNEGLRNIADRAMGAVPESVEPKGPPTQMPNGMIQAIDSRLDLLTNLVVEQRHTIHRLSDLA